MLELNDLCAIPFSRRGGWWAIGRLNAAQAAERGVQPGLFLRTMRGGIQPRREVFAMDFPDAEGAEAPMEERFDAGRLVLSNAGGEVECVFVAPNRLRLRGRGVGLRLHGEGGPFATFRKAGEGRWEGNFIATRTQMMITAVRGKVEVRAPWGGDGCATIEYQVRPDGSGSWEVELEEFRGRWRPPELESFESGARACADAFTDWMQTEPGASGGDAATRELAGYIRWSTLVGPAGQLPREAMLMSKNWMANIWSWDHCFNAIASLPGKPDLAWDQWAILFDLQDADGALPDCANDNEIVWNFVKPPIHGWALQRMRERGLELDTDRLRFACERLTAWTEWWWAARDEDGDGLPQYNHGNDSGWDNASCFAGGMPVEGPDLAAFLASQMFVLAGLCDELGQSAEAAVWNRRAEALMARMLELLWVEADVRFVCRDGDNCRVEPGDSLVTCMPLILGERLPDGVREALVRRVERFVTPHGLATEHPESPFYTADGYWRGPIWAPTTYLIVDALRRIGEDALARRIAEGFQATCMRSGMAENYDALTGDGLRDRAYSWSASVYLTLNDEIGRK